MKERPYIICKPDCATMGKSLSFGLFTIVRQHLMHSRMTKFAKLFDFGVHHTEVRPSGPALLCKSTPPRNVLFHLVSSFPVLLRPRVSVPDAKYLVVEASVVASHYTPVSFLPRRHFFAQCLLPSLSPVRRSSCCLLHSAEPFHVHMESGGGPEGSIDHFSKATCAMCRTVCHTCSIECRSESGQLLSFIVVIGNERFSLCRRQPFLFLGVGIDK